MWGFEHTLMSAVSGGLVAALLVRRHLRWALLVTLTQVPFWAGFLAYVESGNPSPASMNAITNIIMAGVFVHIGSVMQERGRSNATPIAICVVFLVLSTVDAIQIMTPIGVYVIVQEVGHYAALALIWKRTHVDRIYSRFNRGVHSPDNGEGRDLA